MIKLGDMAKDKITGFEGIVIGRTEWLHGCARITIQPAKLTADGKVPDAVTFDELQCEIVKARAAEPATPAQRTKGGPRPDPVRR